MFDSRAILGVKKDAVKSLLSAGAEVDIPDSCGQTALHAACLAGDLEIVQRVLSKTVNIHLKDLRLDLNMDKSWIDFIL